MKVTSYGAAREVTGSCHLIETNGGAKVLIDCGLMQGVRMADERNRDAFPFAAASVQALLVTHAHADHTGRIPKLVSDGFTGFVYATAPTAEITKLLWSDNLVVMEYEYEKTGHLPFFGEKDVDHAVQRLKPVDYHERTEVAPGVFATWYNAGHILGSSFILVEADGMKVVFSGDQGNHGSRILPPGESLPEGVDVLYVEATYGDKVHEDQDTRIAKLTAACRETLGAGGTLLIPSFAIERTQELLFDLNEIVETAKIPRVPVFLDSPLAIDTLAVFRKYSALLRHDLPAGVKDGDDFFSFPGLTLTRTRDESRTINDTQSAKIIIAGAGMMNGGRIVHHLLRYLGDPRSEVLVIGYQAAGTLGRHILDGEKNVAIVGKHVEVKARVRAIGAYSAHADKNALLEWIGGGKNSLSQVVVIHSDAPVADAFVEIVKTELGLPTRAPALGETIEIGKK